MDSQANADQKSDDVVEPEEARRLLEESVYHGQLRCAECDWTEDLPDDATIRDARALFEEHFESEHQGAEA